MFQDVISRRLKLDGELHLDYLVNTNNYAALLVNMQRFEEAKALLRKYIPIARSVLSKSHKTMLRMRKLYALALYRVQYERTSSSIFRGVTTNVGRSLASGRAWRVSGFRFPLALVRPLTCRLSRHTRHASSLVRRLAILSRGSEG